MSTPFLREQARVRAQALRRQDNNDNWDDNDDDDELTGQYDAFGRVASRDSATTITSSISYSNSSSSHQQQQYHHHPPQQHNHNSASVTSSKNNDVAASARKEWRHHGTGVTQALEEQRHQRQWTVVADENESTNHHAADASTTSSSTASSSKQRRLRQRGLTVSIISAQKRVDSAHQEFTAYVIRVDVEEVHNDETTISKREVFTEHRYSEFAKLNQLLVRQSQSSKSMSADMPVFPARSWAGRVGNWTPSQMFAPQQYEELIRYRLVQLDAWLVHVTAAAVAGSRQFSPECQAAVLEFLLQPTPLPCDRVAAPLDSSRTNNNNNKTSLTKHATNTNGGVGGSSLSQPQAFWQWNNPFSFTLGSGIRQACRTVELMCLSSSSSSGHASSNQSSLPSTSMALKESDQSIPIDLLRAARGLMFMTVVKGGLVISGRFGTGIVIARRDNKQSDDGSISSEWSAPCAVGTLGLGWGALAGADVTHFLVVLTTDKAVQDLVGGAHPSGNNNNNASGSGAGSALSNSVVQLGAELSVAVGPIGRGANSHLQTGDWTLHPAYAYAHSQGLFVGMSIEGSVISVRHDVNAKFYGRSDFAASSGNKKKNSNYALVEILQNMPPPKAAEPLYQVLDQAMQVEIRQGSFRPSQLLWSHAGNNIHHYDLNSPATQPFHHPHQQQQHSGSDGSGSGSGTRGDFDGRSTRRSSSSSRSSSNNSSNKPQHQYLHPHHHEQFLYPKENQHHYHQEQHEKDAGTSRRGINGNSHNHHQHHSNNDRGDGHVLSKQHGGPPPL